MATAYGVLTEVLRVHEGDRRRNEPDKVVWKDAATRPSFGSVNADLLMKRLWIGESDTATVDHLAKVAAACAELPTGLLDGLAARRRAAARRVARGGGATATSLLITPLWRMVVGHGEDTAHETSLTMSPTYGMPVLPGSALKGVAASQARALHGDPLPAELARIFGTPRPGRAADAERGSVVVLDALPAEPPSVVVDVLTPHVKPYYDKDEHGNPKEPPAEYHSPVPVRFLAVGRTPFRCWLIGPSEDVRQLAGLLTQGLDDLGLGGKTAAGYGYCTVVVEP